MKQSHKQKKRMARKMLTRFERKRISLAPLVGSTKGFMVSHLWSSGLWIKRKEARATKELARRK